MINEIVVFPSSGKEELRLSLSNLIGEGGEGAVYTAKPKELGGKKIAIKLFSQKKLSKNRDWLFQKISTMVKIGGRNNKSLIKHSKIAWPQMSVHDKDGQFIGYAMKYAVGKPLAKLAHPKVYEKHFPDMDREKVAHMLIRLWKSADFLHQRNIFIGDVNLSNVLCKESYSVCWIDVDSFQVGTLGEPDFFPCPVGRPEMTPPEHLDLAIADGYSKINRTRESDLFSLAILTFQCLMLGRHPYEHIGGGRPVDNMRKGHVPYLTGGFAPGKEGGVPPGPWYNIWDWYTHDIKKNFQLALRDGTSDPSRRPSAESWVEVLNAYIGVLNHHRSSHRREMMPDEPKPRGQDPRDTREARPPNGGKHNGQ